MIKHYSSSPVRSLVIVHVPDISVLNVRPERLDDDHVIADIYMRGGHEIYIALTDAELEELIEDIKAGVNV